MREQENLHLKKIQDRIAEIRQRFLYADEQSVEDVAAAQTMAHLPLASAKRLPYRRVADGFRWGKPWGTAWFRLRFRIPARYRGETVVLQFQTGGEALIFRNGRPVQALDRGRDEYILFDRARGGERVELWVESGANQSFGEFAEREMRLPRLAILNRDAWDAYWDMAALADMIDPVEHKLGWDGRSSSHALHRDDTRRARILFALRQAVDLFDYGNLDRAGMAEQSRKARRMLKPLYAMPASASEQTLACMGHAHIDVAWLWPLSETVRKCGRTFSNVLELMERYPEFKFMQSQPQLYEYTKQRYPGIYRKIRERVKRGQWFPDGCMWVEADCNLTSGESLVRQILFGTRFIRQEFGRSPSCLWLPDVFGYSAALPQLLRRSGIRYFLTQKISWSQFTTFPFHSFHWEGIDGSRVLSHFVPSNDYNARLEAYHLLGAARHYREKDRSSIQAVPFGYGDGGGGPTPEMLERLGRYRNLEGMPRLEPMSPEEFFGKLDQESASLPLWTGELYLEYHRGTYTTQGRIKRLNRQAEVALREAEILSSLAYAEGARYDQKRLNALWKTVLLNQFHDILPGSSIDEVYLESEAQLEGAVRDAQTIADGSLAKLARSVDTRGEGTPVLVFNTLSWEREEPVAIDPPRGMVAESTVAVSSGGETVPVQVGHDGRARFRARVSSVGSKLFHVRAGRGEQPPVRATTRGMENDRIRLRFDRAGRLVKLFDKTAGREVLAPGEAGNRLQLFEDKTASGQPAWDIDIFFNEKMLEVDGKLLSVTVLETGPVRAVVRFERALSRSTLTQDVILTAGSSRVDFATQVQWGDEKDVLLKTAFPVDIRSGRARYEIQFGSVERPTHWNRPQDFAMFEVPAQRWADLSESGYGVALLNDCKYGYDIRGNVMRLTLLRAARYPGKNADINRMHEFTYSIFPHAGDFTRGVPAAAAELNSPLRALRPAKHVGDELPVTSWLKLDTGQVIVDSVKKAEDDDGVIVRMVETHGGRCRCELTTSLSVSATVETNLMEEEERELPIRDGRVALQFTPFQIRTLKLRVGRRAGRR